MSDQTQMKAVDRPKRRGRRLFRWLGGAVLLVLGLILAGTIYESVSEAADVRAYPPPGQMVDVGGYRLHINCMGTGTPTVVIDAGWGDWSLSWGWVQREVAKTTQVCTYDRAGMGYSEAGPLPRNAEQFAKELHILLARANIAGPYVLAGHSLGGLPVRVFAHDYPTEVAGVVLIDSMSPGQMDATAHRNKASDSLPIEWSLTALPVGAYRISAFTYWADRITVGGRNGLCSFIGDSASCPGVGRRRRECTGEFGSGGCSQDLRRFTADRSDGWLKQADRLADHAGRTAPIVL